MKDHPLSAVFEKAPDDGADSPPRHSRVDEEFALLMTMCARVAQAPLPAPPLPSFARGGGVSAPVPAGRPAEIWRPVDGLMTTATGTGAEAAPANTTFTTEVVHKELGAMSITVERKDSAVRVVFEVADAVARVAIETQRASLLSSLYAAGVKVASVTVAIRTGGIAFAQRSVTTKPKRPPSETSPDVGNEAPGALDVVG